MSSSEPVYFLRIGGNAEKEIVKKTINFFSGIIAKANLFESSPGMLSSLFVNVSSPPLNKDYIIDPVTYVYSFNPYLERSLRSWQKVNKNIAKNKLIEDLKLDSEDDILPEWIRPIAKPKKGQLEKVEVLGVKRAYRKLADILLPDSLGKIIGHRALLPEDFNNENISTLVENTLKYQLNALINSKYNVDKYAEFVNELPRPKFILGPYFNIINAEWLEIMLSIWDKIEIFKNISPVLHLDINCFIEHSDKITKKLFSLNNDTIFLWLNDFDETSATESQLIFYSDFIKQCVIANKKVINLYAGGFSTQLIPFGLMGIVNGPGYGLEKDAEPVTGGIPTAQYYIPTLHDRMPVLEAYNIIESHNLGHSKETFHLNICNCPICQKAIHSNVSDMILFFGETGEPKLAINGTERSYSTTEALERCNFHFILSRLIEFRTFKNYSSTEAIENLKYKIALWHNKNNHLKKWLYSLENSALL